MAIRYIGFSLTYALAIANGAVAGREPSDEFHGNRNAQFRDPWGHRWTVTMPIHDLFACSVCQRSAKAASSPRP